MPTIAVLMLLVALAAPAPLAAGESRMLAQAQTTGQEPTAPGEADDAAQPEGEPAQAPQETEPQSQDEPQPAQEAQPPGEAQPAEEAQTPEEAEPQEGPQPQEEAQPGGDTPTQEEAQPSPEGEAEPEASEEAAETEPAEDSGILRSAAALPEPVRETWQALVEAARSGHIERLQPVMEAQAEPPMVAFDDVGDPIAYLKSLSGDAEGREILAILLEVLEAGFLHVDEGTPQEMYLWPYFARYPVEDLTARQMVELFTLLTAGDYQDMLSYGAYIFFRVGIAPDGRWLFFVAGD